MEYVVPIKRVDQINRIKEILKKQSKRDHLLFVFGINTGLNISDLLLLKISDIWEGEQTKDFLQLYDEKHKEVKKYYLNSKIEDAVKLYLNTKNEVFLDEYIFKSKKNNLPITRQQAYRIINHAAREAGITEKIGTHTLRKTFGYHAYKKGIAISILMSIYNHQTPAETFRYLGICKSDNYPVKVDVNL
ncbi:tyrosine-type recombinase/integrase [Sutcliffiella cohnii]|uniref:Site-specific integrase n=1 Tax=Sutcliffiella cohnii TaxID=33932 RepID=A0A223KSV7_9BACI|nr:tyrosine-type recombinase/integrase [Sutcliffiella cohnii]AST92581.1 site-specific integrase [Sutcliffiella cohnii]